MLDPSSLAAREYYRQFKILSIDQKIYHTTAVIISLTLIGCVLSYLKFVLVPLTLAIFLTYFLAPVVDLLTMRPAGICCALVSVAGGSPGPETPTRRWMRRVKPILDLLVMFKFPNWLAVILSFLLAFLSMFMVGGVIVYSVNEFIDHSDKYVSRVNELSNVVFTFAMKLGLESASHREKFLDYLTQLPLGSTLTELLQALFKMVANTLLIMIIVVYLLLGRTDQDRSVIRREIDQQIRHYIVLKVLISASFGILVSIVLGLLEVDLAVVFGLMCFILNFVPTVGSIIAILLPLPVILLDPDKSWVASCLAMTVPACLSFIFGWIIEPSLFGSSMQLSEIAVLIALVFWSALWGIAGAVLSVPILVVAKICLGQVDHPIAQYMLKCIKGFDSNSLTHSSQYSHLSGGSNSSSGGGGSVNYDAVVHGVRGGHRVIMTPTDSTKICMFPGYPPHVQYLSQEEVAAVHHHHHHGTRWSDYPYGMSTVLVPAASMVPPPASGATAQSDAEVATLASLN